MQHSSIFIPSTVEDFTEFISMLNPLILEEKIISKHLYVKQHSITKLLYFGVTIQDPIKYRGSGIHWQRHLKKHGRGKDYVKTLCVWTFNYQSDATEFALKFSNVNNIVESAEWANKITEDALGGGCPKGWKQSDTHKQNLSIVFKGKQKSDTHKHNIKISHQNMSSETKEIRSRKISDTFKGVSLSDDHKQKLSDAHKGVPLSDKHKQALKDGQQNMSLEDKLIQYKRISIANTGNKLYDKVGEKSKFFKEQPEDPTWIPRTSVKNDQE